LVRVASKKAKGEETAVGRTPRTLGRRSIGSRIGMFTRESRMEDMFGRYFEPEELEKDEDEWCKDNPRGEIYAGEEMEA
jgi:hypothetical protein